MAATASEIGIPEYMVHLRHEIIHGRELPSVAELSAAAAKALEWLYDQFWSGIPDPFDNTAIESGAQEIASEIRGFLRRRREEIKSKMPESGTDSAVHDSCRTLVLVCKGRRRFLESVAGHLLEAATPSSNQYESVLRSCFKD